MTLKGIIKVNGRELEFEFATMSLGKVLGSKTCWTDDTFSVESLLTIDGNKIGEDYYNFILTQTFKRMYKDVDFKINDLIFTDEDYITLANEVTFYIESVFNEEFNEWYRYYYCNKVNGVIQNPIGLGKELMPYLLDHIYSVLNFSDLLRDLYELSNGYHNLSQWNYIVEYIANDLNFNYNDYLLEENENDDCVMNA